MRENWNKNGAITIIDWRHTMRTLIFDLWGEHGHFRKYYSTSSPVTFSFIPPTAVFGVIAAILGLEKEDNKYLKVLNDAGTKIGIGVRSPVKKTMIGLNLINTKGNVWVPKQRKEGARTQIRTEFLRDACFRIYVSIEDNILHNRLVDQVKHHRTHFTLSLGLSECLAGFAFVDEIDAKLKESLGMPVSIHSIIPINKISAGGISVSPGSFYGKEMVPVQMNEERIVSSYQECIFDMKGNEVLADVIHFWESENHRFVFVNG